MLEKLRQARWRYYLPNVFVSALDSFIVASGFLVSQRLVCRLLYNLLRCARFPSGTLTMELRINLEER